jgi:hypothetical protein
MHTTRLAQGAPPHSTRAATAALTRCAPQACPPKLTASERAPSPREGVVLMLVHCDREGLALMVLHSAQESVVPRNYVAVPGGPRRRAADYL